jgi:hypothetical protein
MFRQAPIRSVLSISRRTFAEASKLPSSDAPLVLNFCTPHAPVFKNKQVQKVMLPGEIGEFGITAGHSPLISQLKPGVVTVQHVNVSFHAWLFHLLFETCQRARRVILMFLY